MWSDGRSTCLDCVRALCYCRLLFFVWSGLSSVGWSAPRPTTTARINNQAERPLVFTRDKCMVARTRRRLTSGTVIFPWQTPSSHGTWCVTIQPISFHHELEKLLCPKFPNIGRNFVGTRMPSVKGRFVLAAFVVDHTCCIATPLHKYIAR